MKTPAAQDRLKPSLLDRLIGLGGDAVSSTAPRSSEPEAAASRSSERGAPHPAAAAVSRRQLRESVARDLIWLLNATRAQAPSNDDPWRDTAVDAEREAWADVPLARASVLNFGLPAMSGRSQSSLDRRRLQRDLVEAIHRFEPRILPESLSVSLDADGPAAPRGAHRPLRLVIQAELRNDPVPMTLWMAAELDLDTGHARLRDLRG